MYYGGGMDGLSMDDLAANEQAANAGAAAPVFSPGDINAIGQAGANVGNMFAQYQLAKAGILPQQQQAALAAQMQAAAGQQNALAMQQQAGAGWSTGTKVAVAIGVGAVALGALVWIVGAKKRNNPIKSLWRTIGE